MSFCSKSIVANIREAGSPVSYLQELCKIRTLGRQPRNGNFAQLLNALIFKLIHFLIV